MHFEVLKINLLFFILGKQYLSGFVCFITHETGIWYLFHLIYAMQLVTPSAVAMADSTLMAVWIANFQNVLFFMINFVLN